MSDEFDERCFVVSLDDEDDVRDCHHHRQCQHSKADGCSKDQNDTDHSFDHPSGQNKQAIIKEGDAERLHEVPLILRDENLAQCRRSQLFTNGQSHKRNPRPNTKCIY